MKRFMHIMAGGLLGAALLVAPGAGTAHAADPAPQPVRPSAWADTAAEQNAVLDYWQGDDLARWDFEVTDYGTDGPLLSYTDEGRPWSSVDPGKAAAVNRSVGRMFMRQSATFEATERTARADDVVGAVRETGAFKAWNGTTQQLVPADPAVPAERRFLETVEITGVANGKTTEVRRLSWPSNCSATSVDGDNGRTVVSAGHCVLAPVAVVVANNMAEGFTNGAIDITNDAMVFVPGYDGHGTTLAAQAPYGIWVVSKVYTTGQWHEFASVGLNAINPFNMQFDVSMMTVVDPTRPNVRLADVVGTQHIGFNQPFNKTAYAMGYPAAPSADGAVRYDGRDLIYCTGPAKRDLLMSLNYQVKCNLTGGSSGGPMLHGFAPVSGVGTVVSVNSFKYSWAQDLMNGPYFNDNIRNVYNIVRNL